MGEPGHCSALQDTWPFPEDAKGRKKKQADRKVEFKNLTESTAGAAMGFRRVFSYPVVHFHAPAVALAAFTTSNLKKTNREQILEDFAGEHEQRLCPRPGKAGGGLYLDWLE